MAHVTSPILFSILGVLALILLNATWVAAEFAIVRVRRTRLEELAGQGVETAKHAIIVVDRISDYLALTQIGITVASLAVGWLAEDAVVSTYRSALLTASNLGTCSPSTTCSNDTTVNATAIPTVWKSPLARCRFLAC
jgi:CBS domain containing-hemolysin-like protein